jgi:hypothetical protein
MFAWWKILTNDLFHCVIMIIVIITIIFIIIIIIIITRKIYGSTF